MSTGSLGASLRARSESPLLHDAPELWELGGGAVSSGGGGSGASSGASVLSGADAPAHSLLLSAQSARKRAEQDAILLANRIRLLRAEEEKTRRKTHETESKVKSIVEVRHRNEERRFARQSEEEARRMELQEMRVAQLGQREEQRRKIEVKQKEICQQKSDAYQQQRLFREDANRRIQHERAAVQAALAARSERIRRAEQAVHHSRARSESAKQDAARHALEDRIIQEEEARKEKQELIAEMEREEAALLAKLQQSQERHRAAFVQLEDAVRHPSQPGARTQTSAAPGPPNTAARPPRPRVPVSAAYPAALAGATSGSRPNSARRPSRGMPAAMASARCSSEAKAITTSKPALRSGDNGTSSCSTMSGGVGSVRGTADSGRSTPMSPATMSVVMPAQTSLTYTTVDGTQLDIPNDDDLDLASLLNS